MDVGGQATGWCWVGVDGGAVVKDKLLQDFTGRRVALGIADLVGLVNSCR